MPWSNKGGGKFKVLIYDNNWPGADPGDLVRHQGQHLDLRRRHQPEPAGRALRGRRQDQDRSSCSRPRPALGTQPCPFCGKVPNSRSTTGAVEQTTPRRSISSAATPTTPISSSPTTPGTGSATSTGSWSTRSPAPTSTQLISNQDWTTSWPRTSSSRPTARTRSPSTGPPLTSADTETVGIIGPSYDLSVDDIPHEPRRQGHPGGRAGRHQAQLYQLPRRVTRPSRSLSPTTRPTTPSTVGGVSDQPGSTINLCLPAEGGSLTMDNVGSARAFDDEPQDDPIHPGGHPGLPPRRHLPRRRGHRRAPVRQLDQHQPGHPPASPPTTDSSRPRYSPTRRDSGIIHLGVTASARACPPYCRS